jgi:hypothetical protein
MKKKRSTKPNARPKKRKPTNPQSPWRKVPAIPPKPAAPLPCDEPELISGGGPDDLADEIEAAEAAQDKEPDELPEE